MDVCLDLPGLDSKESRICSEHDPSLATAPCSMAQHIGYHKVIDNTGTSKNVT